MLDINLLSPPGLQGAVAEPVAEEPLEEAEDAIIKRLEARVKEEVPPAEVPKPKKKSRLRIWIIVFMLIGVAAAYLWYQGWTWQQLREKLPFLESLAVPRESKFVAEQPVPCAKIMARFLEGLPQEASLDYLEAGGGIMVYRIWGQDLAQVLLPLSAQVDGYQYSDFIQESPPNDPGYWLGAVVYAPRGQVGLLRPTQSDYERFFRRLQDMVRDTGGTLVEMIPGTMTMGEYVIQGTLDEIQSHLVSTTADPAKVHFHRVGLFKPEDSADGDYLLRVVFNLVEEPESSPQLSSPASTGA